MGSLAFARGARDGYVRDLNHPDQPLGGDDLTSVRGQLRVVLSPRSEVVLSTDASDQAGRILSNHKILSLKPGFAVDNPADPRDVRLSTVNSSGVRHVRCDGARNLSIDAVDHPDQHHRFPRAEQSVRFRRRRLRARSPGVAHPRMATSVVGGANRIRTSP